MRSCRQILLAIITGIAAFGLASRTEAAPPEVTAFFPTGVQRGQTAEIVASGNVGTWPPKVWTELPGLAIEPAADKGKLKVTAAADAPVGIHWVRLANDEGASLPRPLLVGSFPELVETEPNDAPGQAQTVGSQQFISGKLAKRGDVDVFAVTLEPGQTLIADLVANELLGSPMDAVLQLCDAAGNVLDQQHDTRGLDPRVVYTAQAAGTYLVRIFAFPAQPDSSINFAGGDSYIYRLTFTTGGFVDHTLPLAFTRGSAAELALVGWNLPAATLRLEPTGQDWRDNLLWQPPDAAGLVPLRSVGHPSLAVAPSAGRQTPQAVPTPVTLTGQLQSPGDEDAFSVTATKGKSLEIRVESTRLGYDADPVVSVIDSAGKTVVENDDGRRSERDPSLTFSPPADGTYQILVRDLHGRGGMRMVYVCTIAEQQPSYSLTVAAGSFRVAPGMTVDVPVTINRQGGFKEDLEISAAGLPAGVSGEVVRSPGEGEASKSVKLVLKAATDAQSGPLRIVAKSSAGERFATFETTQGDAKFLHRDLWLSAK
jgi:hypothetical protein